MEFYIMKYKFKPKDALILVFTTMMSGIYCVEKQEE